jgi:hypothetical protein
MVLDLSVEPGRQSQALDTPCLSRQAFSELPLFWGLAEAIVLGCPGQVSLSDGSAQHLPDQKANPSPYTFVC